VITYVLNGLVNLNHEVETSSISPGHELELLVVLLLLVIVDDSGNSIKRDFVNLNDLEDTPE
jgi:hypothetical protein